MLLIAREMECVNWHLLSDIFSPLWLGWSQLLQNPMTPYLSLVPFGRGLEERMLGTQLQIYASLSCVLFVFYVPKGLKFIHSFV